MINTYDKNELLVTIRNISVPRNHRGYDKRITTQQLKERQSKIHRGHFNHQCTWNLSNTTHNEEGDPDSWNLSINVHHIYQTHDLFLTQMRVS